MLYQHEATSTCFKIESLVYFFSLLTDADVRFFFLLTIQHEAIRTCFKIESLDLHVC
jgi:hypothetical protein